MNGHLHVLVHNHSVWNMLERISGEYILTDWSHSKVTMELNDIAW